MPLPENWDGVFYSAETSGDMIFDLSPEEFIDTLREHQPQDAKFLVAGAIFDLLWNNHFDLAERFMTAAEERWPGPDPKANWGMLLILKALAMEMILVSVPRNKVGLAVSNVVSGWFNGGLTLRLYEPKNLLDEVSPN